MMGGVDERGMMGMGGEECATCANVGCSGGRGLPASNSCRLSWTSRDGL